MSASTNLRTLDAKMTELAEEHVKLAHKLTESEKAAAEAKKLFGEAKLTSQGVSKSGETTIWQMFMDQDSAEKKMKAAEAKVCRAREELVLSEESFETEGNNRQKAEEEEARVAEEHRRQLSATFRRNQMKCVKDQRKLKLAEEEFIDRCISAEEFLAERQQAEAAEAKRLDEAAKAAEAKRIDDEAAALKQQRRKATTTINEKIKTAAITRQALFNQDAMIADAMIMIAANSVSNMCHTRHGRIAVVHPAIIIHGQRQKQHPVTAPPAYPATTSAQTMMDDIYTLDDEDPSTMTKHNFWLPHQPLTRAKRSVRKRVRGTASEIRH